MNLLDNFFRFSIGFFLLSTMSFAASAESERRVNVFAAASLKPVLDQLAADFSRENGNTI